MSVVKIRNNGTNIRFFAKYKVVDSEVFGRTCFCLGLLKQKKLTANLSGLLRQEKENREFVVLLSVLHKFLLLFTAGSYVRADFLHQTLQYATGS